MDVEVDRLVHAEVRLAPAAGGKHRGTEAQKVVFGGCPVLVLQMELELRSGAYTAEAAVPLCERNLEFLCVSVPLWFR